MYQLCQKRHFCVDIVYFAIYIYLNDVVATKTELDPIHYSII